MSAPILADYWPTPQPVKRDLPLGWSNHDPNSFAGVLQRVAQSFNNLPRWFAGITVHETDVAPPGEPFITTYNGKRTLHMHPLDVIAERRSSSEARLDGAMHWILQRALHQLDALSESIHEAGHADRRALAVSYWSQQQPNPTPYKSSDTP